MSRRPGPGGRHRGGYNPHSFDRPSVHVNVHSDSMLLVLQSRAAWQCLRKQRQRLRLWHPMRAAMLTMDALCREDAAQYHDRAARAARPLA